MPRKTEAGAEAAAKWKAFRRYLDDIEKYENLNESREIFDRYLPFTVAFFSGRLASYTIYATAARTLRGQTPGDALTRQLGSPVGVALQLAMIGALVALTMIDWTRVLKSDRIDS